MRYDNIKFITVPGNRGHVRLKCLDPDPEMNGLFLRCERQFRKQIAAGQVFYVNNVWINRHPATDEAFLESGDRWDEFKGI